MKKAVLFPSFLLICALFAPLAASAQVVVPQAIQQAASASVGSAPSVLPQPVVAAAPVLSADQIAAKIADAKKLLKANSPVSSFNTVTLATLDAQTSQIHLLTLQKESFLQRGAQLFGTTSLGHLARVEVERANGVNTAVTVTDSTTNRQLLPLVVQYPIEKNGQ